MRCLGKISLSYSDVLNLSSRYERHRVFLHRTSLNASPPNGAYISLIAKTDELPVFLNSERKVTNFLYVTNNCKKNYQTKNQEYPD